MRCHRQRRRLTPALTGLSLAVMIVGCGGGDTGPPRTRVSGQVTFDSKPVEKGTIEFTPIDGTAGDPAQGAIEAGKYDLPAATGPAVKGRYKVSISALRPAAGKPLMNPFEAVGVPAPKSLQQMQNYIPAKYNVQSTLTATISEDSSKNHFDFALEPGPPPKPTKRRR
jgi:hypothetical protein